MKFPAKLKSKKILIIGGIIAVLFIISIILIVASFKDEPQSQSAPKLSESDTAKFDQIDQAGCNKNLESINNIDAQKLSPTEQLKIYNYKANCYYSLGKYEEVITAGRSMIESCQAIMVDPVEPNYSCKGGGEAHIALAEDAIKNPKPVGPTKVRSGKALSDE